MACSTPPLELTMTVQGIREEQRSPRGVLFNRPERVIGLPGARTRGARHPGDRGAPPRHKRRRPVVVAVACAAPTLGAAEPRGSARRSPAARAPGAGSRRSRGGREPRAWRSLLLRGRGQSLLPVRVQLQRCGPGFSIVLGRGDRRSPRSSAPIACMLRPERSANSSWVRFAEARQSWSNWPSCPRRDPIFAAIRRAPAGLQKDDCRGHL
jgi:hypothetical protein